MPDGGKIQRFTLSYDGWQVGRDYVPVLPQFSGLEPSRRRTARPRHNDRAGTLWTTGAQKKPASNRSELVDFSHFRLSEHQQCYKETAYQ
ncbi:hypothetical protein CLV75_3674 [Ruegeria conchae]|uniref:Uncharacterized protein n=1 Tax=Ruegeria conchae TaxID=981384 RepID=A0A497YZ52_9RHOB|nr:hypothetical protein CLV75_3674 [Ruegeria conchae]